MGTSSCRTDQGGRPDCSQTLVVLVVLVGAFVGLRLIDIGRLDTGPVYTWMMLI